MSVTRRSFLASSAIAAGSLAAMGLAGCSGSGSSASGSAGSSAAAAGSYPNGSICVIRNMTSSDHTTQFFNGITDEGNALGFKVDTFMSDGDDSKMVNLLEQNLDKDYKIWIVSHANEGYQYDKIKAAVDKGIKVVGFDCAGDEVEGVTYTTQDDASLTDISMDAMIEKVGSTPVKFIEVNTLGALAPFDRRHEEIETYIADGKLERAQLISPNLAGGDAYSDINTGVTTTLAADTNQEIKGLWTASSGFLDGAIDAIKAAGRDDIVCTAIDISDTEVQRLAAEDMYYCCAAVDPYVIGLVDTRIAVCKLLGEETPAEYQFEAVGITNDQVTADDSMATLSNYFDQFGSSDEYDTEGIEAVRAAAAEGKAYEFTA